MFRSITHTKRKYDSESCEPKQVSNKKRNKNNRNKIDQENDTPIRNNPIKYGTDLTYLLNLCIGPDTDDPIVPEESNIKKTLPCKNPLCDHDDNSTNFKIVEIDKITSSHDLVMLGKSYHCKKNILYKGINLRLLCDIVEPLTELNEMVGLCDVKKKIVNQIIFFVRGYHIKEKCNTCIDCAYNIPCANSRTDMLHTVITGPPGVGKTQLARIIGKIYSNMGILSKGTFTEVGREDLIAQYLGQTAIKTQKKIKECTGGVMFIDEVYALGNSEKRDSFSKECIDTLNRSLSNVKDLLCIIAGYEKDIDKCFFAYNAGLRRRFTFTYDIGGYTPSQLYEIFCSKVTQCCWVLNLSTAEVLKIKTLFRDKYDYFPAFGGDIETLLLQCKISHSKNTNISNDANTRELCFEDIKDGFNSFVSNRKYDESNNIEGAFI